MGQRSPNSFIPLFRRAKHEMPWKEADAECDEERSPRVPLKLETVVSCSQPVMPQSGHPGMNRTVEASWVRHPRVLGRREGTKVVRNRSLHTAEVIIFGRLPSLGVLKFSMTSDSQAFNLNLRVSKSTILLGQMSLGKLKQANNPTVVSI